MKKVKNNISKYDKGWADLYKNKPQIKRKPVYAQIGFKRLVRGVWLYLTKKYRWKLAYEIAGRAL